VVKKMEIINKQEAAKRWNISPSMIPKYIAKGMPVAENGRLNWPEVERWRNGNISPERSGSYKARHRKDQRPNSTNLPNLASLDSILSPEKHGARQLMDRILSRRHLVPEVLSSIGVSDPVLLHCADDLFVALIVEFAGPLDPYDWVDGDDLPPVPDPDLAAIFKKHGLKLSKQTIAKADQMADRVYAVLAQVVKDAKPARSK
jgi:hypothetical protein